jgi:outer membrane lipopolysaccharide assembly protein LptE/RlpB
MSKAAAAFLSILVFLLPGCGYHTAGKVSTLPAQIHVLAVPTFVNQTHAYRVEQVLTAAVIHELTTRTQYKIVNDKSDDADATLRADVTQTTSAPVTYDSTTGRASSSLVTITMNVSLLNKKGTVLFSNPNYTFREEYQISRELSSFFNEESPAVQRLSQDVARSLVSNILEGF